MVNPSRIRHLISKIVVDSAHSDGDKIYIDFYDAERARWYLFFSTDRRTFRAIRLEPDGVGTADLPTRLKQYLISITPHEILAYCTAASLGVGEPIDLMVKRGPPAWLK